MKRSELKTSEQFRTEQMQDPEFQAAWERTALARDVAVRLVAYRAAHGLTQSALARKLGMHQPAIARLEAAEHEPSFSMLQRLARELGFEFHIAIGPANERSE